MSVPAAVRRALDQAVAENPLRGYVYHLDPYRTVYRYRDCTHVEDVHAPSYFPICGVDAEMPWVTIGIRWHVSGPISLPQVLVAVSDPRSVSGTVPWDDSIVLSKATADLLDDMPTGDSAVVAGSAAAGVPERTFVKIADTVAVQYQTRDPNRVRLISKH